jgi:predicted DsbA family dithiol-disulfide isomerase
VRRHGVIGVWYAPATGMAPSVPENLHDTPTGSTHDPADVPSDAGPGVVTVYSDIVCPWAHIALHRLRDALARCGADDTVVIEHRAFPLEVLDGRPTPRDAFDRAVEVGRSVAPGAGWEPWDGPEWSFPTSSILALEAVQAAAAQDPSMADPVDHAMRTAFWVHHKCIATMPVVLEVLETTSGIDFDEAAAELWSGRPRATIRHHTDTAATAAVTASPYVVVRGLDGARSWTNPGITTDGPPDRFAIADDEPAAYDDIVEYALASHSYAGG